MLATLAVERCGLLERRGSSIDQLATSVVGQRDGGAMVKRSICKERLSQLLVVQEPLRWRFLAEFAGASSQYGTVERLERRGRADAEGMGLAHR